MTFHRAFDVSCDLKSSLKVLIELGFSRVLTSGGSPTAREGLSTIKELVSISADHIIIVPGGGVSNENLDEILKGCDGLKVQEFHGSASVWKNSRMKYRNETLRMGMSPDYSYKVTDSNNVFMLVDISKRVWRKE